MAESPMVGCRVPEEWYQQIREIASATGQKESAVIREALAQYLGRVDPNAVKGAIASLESRVALLEGKLAGLGRLVG
ncbi:hypothetical protein SD81_028410 [Tolypothrix campylonemoides VB511288]|nr:hypothetical protein SD81_028410 [Tolypothrix campylonemoides VB511288]